MSVRIIQCGNDSLGCASYLLNYSSHWYLIDTSLPSGSRRLIDNIRRYTEEIECVLLTHEHIDHSGATATLQERFHCPVYAHKNAIEVLSRGDDTYIGSRLFGENFRPPASILSLEEGAVTFPGGLTLRVIHTPGHSPGSVVLLLEDEGILFSGDLLFCGGWVGRWDLPGGDLNLLCRSLNSLVEIDFKDLYPGHGSWCRGEGKYHLMGALGYLKGVC